MDPADLPRVDALASQLPAATHALAVEAARWAIARAREQVLAGARVDSGAIREEAERWLAARARPALRPVINATGVVVHTNLGRAPLPPEAVAGALGYCNLEYDLARGERGSRRALIEPLLVELTGAEAALVVNNCAAALVLALAAMRRGPESEVIVSRGELVEIGGSFRIPEILESSGVVLREVGTTNRTYASDYRRALSARTIGLLRVHPSNFSQSGFVARPALDELVRVAREAAVPCLVDLGSDAVGAALPAALTQGEDLAAALAAGADLVMLSGDKLLGGPQAGLVLGRAGLVERLAAHPLMRALRPDKLALAALEFVLRARATAEPGRVPLLGMLALTQAELTARAERLALVLAAAGVRAEVIATADPIGGGSHPEATLPGAGLALTPPPGLGLDGWHARLRQGEPALVALLARERAVIALRTVPEADEPALVRALLASLDIGASTF